MMPCESWNAREAAVARLGENRGLRSRNAEILHHGPPLAYARGRAAVGGAEPWPRVHPGILRGARAAAGL